jgi:hypothetical protein
MPIRYRLRTPSISSGMNEDEIKVVQKPERPAGLIVNEHK